MKSNLSFLESAKRHELANSSAEELLLFTKASSEQIRLDILKVLDHDAYTVMELTEIFAIKQSAMSHHLKLLAESGLVVKRREGNSIFYRRAHCLELAWLNPLAKQLFKALDQYPLVADYLSAIDKIRGERAAKARAFFDEFSGNFSKHQEQVVAYELYGPQMAELVTSALSSSHSNEPNNEQSSASCVLEIGPGDGLFLEYLSEQYQQVVALDVSEEMLNQAQQFTSKQQLRNIEFIQGDTSSSKLKNYRFDAVVMNMVLHHVPSPAALFADIARLLDDGGQLFITELCQHDQDWVKQSCGDLWMGFSPDELTEIANKADFIEGESIYLAQKNGFRVQIRAFIKTRSNR
jgi:2-polyprenyl-3-methyl-5-hydroxy-6-metoxy-1,4-benzoquinol methylase/DNA-binding transcriptional ArsR family regulator